MKIEEAIETLDAMSAIADRASIYNGLRATPIAATGLIGVAAASLQSRLAIVGVDATDGFVGLWSLAAAICLTLVLGDMARRYLREPTPRTRRLTLQVLGRLAPSIVTGGAVAFVILRHAPQLVGTLPSWWAILLGLGICSASTLLPAGLRPVGVWYIGCGLLMLMFSSPALLPDPLAMAIPFGGGQLLTAWLIARESEPVG